MRAMWAICKRDFGALIASPFFYVICGFTTIMYSFGFFRALYNFEIQNAMGQFGQGGPDFHQTVIVPHISIANLLFILVIPILTMRLLSEEKRNRTFDLLLTTPIAATDIALGKFLAGLLAALILILLSALYPLLTLTMVPFEKGPFFTAYVGLILVTGLYVAIGVFCSSLTESVVLAAVVGVIINIALWLFSQWASGLDTGSGTAVMEQIALVQQFVTFIEGKIQVNALVFFLSAIVFFVFLSQRVVESARWR